MPELSLHKKAKRMRIYISDKDQWRGKSLDTAIVETLREKGIAGASVFRGIVGFGAHSLVHTVRIEVLSTELPLVIETIDTPEKIDGILDTIYPMVREGMITIDDVEIVKYTHRYLNPLPADKLASEVMTRDVVSLSPEMPVHLAWKQMVLKEIKATPVVDSANMVVGILTDEDLLERAGIQQRLSVALRMDQDEINQEMKALESSSLKVEDVMTKPVVTALESESLGLVTSRMVKYGLKRLPVVDDGNRLVGVISRLDILRQVAKVSTGFTDQHIPDSAVRTVSDVMTTSIPMASQDDDLSTIIDKFSQTNSHRLVVVDSVGKAIGLLSDSDIVMRVQPNKRRGILDALKNIGKPPFGKETAFDLMSPGPLTVSPHTPVLDALKLMLDNSRKWLVVIDEHNHPMGLVDRQLMMEAIAVFGVPG